MRYFLSFMRSVCQSINLLCTAFGSLAAAGLNSACAAWIPNNLDHGKLDYVFFLLAGLMAANFEFFDTTATGQIVNRLLTDIKMLDWEVQQLTDFGMDVWSLSPVDAALRAGAFFGSRTSSVTTLTILQFSL